MIADCFHDFKGRVGCNVTSSAAALSSYFERVGLKILRIRGHGNALHPLRHLEFVLSQSFVILSGVNW